MKLKNLILLAISILILNVNLAQTADLKQEDKPSRFITDEKPFKTWSIGFYGGLVHPLTDIRYKDWFGTLDPVNENQWNAGIKVTKMFDAAFGLQFRGSYNVLQGAFDTLVVHREDRNYLEKSGITEGIYFRNNVLSSSINIYWNISNTVFGTNRYLKAKAAKTTPKPRKFSLFMFTGVGGTWFDPHVMFVENKTPADLTGVDFQTDQTFEINIPIGIGAKFNMTKAIDIGLEYVINYVFTDKLDGFIFNHPGRIKNDLYTNLNFTMDFKIGNKKQSDQHIEWVQPTGKLYEEIVRLDEIERKLKKLMQDDDEDGVSDFFDKDINTEKGLLVDGSGQALDSDKDGVPDQKDQEPFSDFGAEIDLNGVSLDDDLDGVPNHKDQEKNTKAGNLVNFQGVSIQSEMGVVSSGIVYPSIYFDPDQATIKASYAEDLFLIASDMLRLTDNKFIITGHCDQKGSDEYNIKLAHRRVEAVKLYLIENYKIDPARIKTEAKGKSAQDSPIADINRRVDISLIQN